MTNTGWLWVCAHCRGKNLNGAQWCRRCGCKMSIEMRQAWGWWGEEGGHRLDVKRDGRKVIFTVTSATQPPVSVTLADFRVDQLQRWLLPEEVSQHEPSA